MRQEFYIYFEVSAECERSMGEENEGSTIDVDERSADNNDENNKTTNESANNMDSSPLATNHFVAPLVLVDNHIGERDVIHPQIIECLLRNYRVFDVDQKKEILDFDNANNDDHLDKKEKRNNNYVIHRQTHCVPVLWGARNIDRLLNSPVLSFIDIIDYPTMDDFMRHIVDDLSGVVVNRGYEEECEKKDSRRSDMDVEEVYFPVKASDSDSGSLLSRSNEGCGVFVMKVFVQDL